MTDNQLIVILLNILKIGLTSDGFSTVVVKASNQPTQQGVNTSPTLYYTKLYDKRYGFLGRKDEWNADLSIMQHTETQVYETTFQITSLVLQSPLTPSSYTASDLANEAVSILQSDFGVNSFLKYGIGILRVTDIRNPYFLDDKDNFEAASSFDFTLTYPRIRIITDPVIDSFDYDIQRV